MTRSRKLTWSAVFVVSILLWPMLALAHNCGSLYDCWGTAGAAAAAAAGAGAAAAGGLFGGRSKNEDECEAERDWVFKCQSWVDTYKAQLQYYADQLEKLKGPAADLIAKAQQLAPGAQNEVAWSLVQKMITKLLEIAVSAGPAGPILGSIGTLSDPLSEVPGVAYIRFFNELTGYFELLSGNLDAVADLAEQENLQETKKFVETMRELQRLKDTASTVVNKMNPIREQLEKALADLREAEQALASCEAGGGKAAA